MTPLLSAAILRTQSDRRLVQLARAGHDAAFTVIVERYRAPLRGYCLRILPDGRVDDALQQAFLQAWRALQDGREVRELRPWLYATVHNAAVSQLRRGVFDYVELMDTVQGAEEPEADLERKALMRQTLAAVAALPERQREALLAVALEGLPQAQVAGQMGLSENGLRQLLFRARTTLRSAATALTPLPVLSWALRPAAAGGLHERVAEAAAGAGAAAGGAGAVHAGTALLVASTIAVTGTVSLQHRAVHRSAAASATALGPHDATAVPTAFVVHRVASSGRTRLSAVARHRRAATSTRRRVVRVAALRGRHGLRVAPAGVAVHAAPAAPAAIAPVSVLDPEPTALAAVAAPAPAQTAEPLAPPPATTDDDDGHGDPASSDGRDSGDGHEDGDGRTDGDGGGDHADGDQRTVSADSSGEGGGGDRSAAAQAPHEA